MKWQKIGLASVKGSKLKKDRLAKRVTAKGKLVRALLKWPKIGRDKDQAYTK